MDMRAALILCAALDGFHDARFQAAGLVLFDCHGLGRLVERFIDLGYEFFGLGDIGARDEFFYFFERVPVCGLAADILASTFDGLTQCFCC